MYKFDLNKIIKLRLNLVKDFHKEQDLEKKEIINSDINSLLNLELELERPEAKYDEFNNIVTDKKIPLSLIYKTLKTNLEKFAEVYPEFEKASNITKEFKEEKREKPPLIMDDEELLDLTHEFYKTLNKYFYKFFWKNFKDRYDHVMFKCDRDKTLGMTTFICHKKQAFISLKRENTLNDFTTAVHEYAHAICGMINPKHLMQYNELFIEVIPIYMEMLATDYFDSLFKENDSIILKSNIHINYAYFFDKAVKFLELDKTNSKEFNEKTLRNMPINLGRYLNAYLYATELYSKDQDEALDICKHLISLDEYTPSKVKEIGLSLNDGLLKYQNQIIDEAKVKKL